MPPRLHPLRPALLFALSACAAGTSAEAGGSGGDPLQAPERFTVAVRQDRGALSTALDAPVEAVAQVLPGAHEFLGLPAAPASNTARFTFITPTLEIQGRLYEGEKNSTYLDCGRTVRGEMADIGRVRFVVVTVLRPDGRGGTVMETLVDGNAWDRFQYNAPMPCQGTGKLEAELAGVVLARLAGTSG